MAFSSPLRALSSRNYRLYFTGQIVSLLGSWMTQTATLWLVYQISSSAFYLGLVGFVSQAPAFLLGPIAGTWVDRVNRHRLLVITQVLSMLQSFALAAFAFAGAIDIPHLLVLGAIQGMITAFDMPARQALVVEFVENREHLGNAIALNSTSFNLARLGGPALAGLLIAAVGPAWCYLIDGLSFVAVIICLLLMRFPPMEIVPHTKNALGDLRDGLRYTWAASGHPRAHPARHRHQLFRLLLFRAGAVVCARRFPRRRADAGFPDVGLRLRRAVRRALLERAGRGEGLEQRHRDRRLAARRRPGLLFARHRPVGSRCPACSRWASAACC